MATLRTPQDAFALLAKLGAVPWLVRHHELVVEAAALSAMGSTRDLACATTARSF